MAPLPKRQRRCLSPTSSPATASLDHFLQSALAMSDPSLTIGLSLERLLDSTPLPSDKESLVDGARKLASSLMEAATRSALKLAVAHNSSAWPLPLDLTIKVFSMLDTESLCFAAATCLHFRKCASDPLCYANIDLTRSPAKVTNPVVSTMIQRAGKNLRSIKLGSLSQDENRLDESPLTASCLASLELDGGAAGLLLQKVHLYNLKMKGYNPYSALSACKSLSELEVVGGNLWFPSIWGTICNHCHSIERLRLDAVGFSLNAFQVDDLIKSCPVLSSLALRGLEIEDKVLSVLVKGARGLKSLDLSDSWGFSGIFLRDLGNGGSANSLETLILCDCFNLRAEEVFVFLSAVCCGDWTSLRYVDISNKKGLLVFCGSSGRRFKHCAIEVSEVLQERPDIHLIADYPRDICFYGDCMNWSSSSSDSDSGSLYETASSSDDDDSF